MEEQPTPAPQTVRFVTLEQLGPERMIAIDSIIAVKHGNFDKRLRLLGGGNRWQWRAPRDTSKPKADVSPWIDRPPPFCGLRNRDVFDILDVYTALQRLDIVLSTNSQPDPEGGLIRGYMAGVGTMDGPNFRGHKRTLAETLELAIALLLVALVDGDIDAEATELFVKNEAKPPLHSV